jgi:hypothetical protein
MRSALHPTACWFLSRYSLDERPIRPSGTQDGLRTQRSATAQLAGRSMPGRIETCVSCRQSGDRCRNARQVTDMRSRCVRPATASSRDLGRGRHQVGRRDWAWRDDCSALRWWVAKSNPPYSLLTAGWTGGLRRASHPACYLSLCHKRPSDWHGAGPPDRGERRCECRDHVAMAEYTAFFRPTTRRYCGLCLLPAR